MKGQLSKVQDARQEGVECRLGRLGKALALLEHDTLRVQQAIQRANLEDLLGPVLEDFAVVSRLIRGASDNVRETWEEGQQNRWGK